MFACLNCGYTFETPRHWEEHHGLEHGTFEKWSGCPECGESYVETYRCEECGEWVAGPYVKLSDGRRFCEECHTVYDLGEE